MKKQPKIYQIRSDKLDIWRDWCRELSTTHYIDAVGIIKDEGVLAESFISFKINEIYYTLGAMIGDPTSINTATSQDSMINNRHREVMAECLILAEPGHLDYLLLGKS